jgi:hypothetical protein
LQALAGEPPPAPQRLLAASMRARLPLPERRGESPASLPTRLRSYVRPSPEQDPRQRYKKYGHVSGQNVTVSLILNRMRVSRIREGLSLQSLHFGLKPGSASQAPPSALPMNTAFL